MNQTIKTVNISSWLGAKEKGVVIGFGSSGRLHMGHLALIYQYKRYRRMCNKGYVFISDVAAFFSRKDLDWNVVRLNRESILKDLKYLKVKKNDIFIESMSLRALFDEMKAPDYENYVVEYILTIAEIKNAVENFKHLLVILSRDEEEYIKLVNSICKDKKMISYIVYDDLKSPVGAGKMSKSRPETSLYIDDGISGKYKIKRKYFKYIKNYFKDLADAMNDESRAKKIMYTKDIDEVVEVLK